MSLLVSFYGGEGTDARGRALQEIWNWDNDRWEGVHDFIQWLFPLPEPSRFNPDAPLLTDDDIAAFATEEQLRANVRKSFNRFLTFVGFAWGTDEKIVEGPDFPTRAVEVWVAPNHNWLRITRVLRCLKLLGLHAEARAFYERLDAFYHSRRFPIGADTFHYWTESV